MSKTIKKILSPEHVKAVDGILANRHATREHAKQERRRNDQLLTPDGGVDVTNKEAQAGRRMSRADFVRRLQKLNPNIRYQKTKRYPDRGGIYWVGYRRDNLLGTTEYGEWFICGMPHEVVGEFDVRVTKRIIIPHVTDPVMVPMDQVDDIIRGWRTVLLKLLLQGVLTHSQIDNEFQISKGRSSQNWQNAAVN